MRLTIAPRRARYPLTRGLEVGRREVSGRRPRTAICACQRSRPLPLRAITDTPLDAKRPPAVGPSSPGAIPRSRLDAGQTDWLAELRRVTILFINLPDFKYDTPLMQSQEAMCALQTNLYRYEGSINKISVDDKGTSLLAALGLPPLAHEDDAVRGVRAALAMQARCSGWISRAWSDAGQAFCGAVGSARRRDKR